MHELHLIIYGHVHGVCFREYTETHARKLDITGWSKNLPDGTLEILAQGERNRLEQLKRLCGNGPRFARVDRIDEEWREIAERAYDSFTIVFSND